MADYSSSIDINANESAARLLSLESPIISLSTSYYQTTPGGDDLSLSELSLCDQTPIMQRPFSLLARVDSPEPVTPTQPSSHERQNEVQDKDDGDLLETESLQRIQQEESKRKEEKLQSDIFILKKLNASFESFNEALQQTGSANQRIAGQLEQTNSLLDNYVEILSKCEDFSRLIFDEQWEGADADEEAIERERLEKERHRQEQEAEVRRIKQENHRLEMEREMQNQREEKERLEREKLAKMVRGGIRGIRGTRASMSMRGMRGSALPRPAEPIAGVSRGIPRRPPSGLARPATSSMRGSSRPV